MAEFRRRKGRSQMATTALNRQIIDDAWTIVQLAPDESPTTLTLPEAGGIFPLALWLARKQEIISRYKRIGLRLEQPDELEAIAHDLHYFRIIAIGFPDSADSRVIATARLLRERYGYRGEVRALRDVGKPALSLCMPPTARNDSLQTTAERPAPAKLRLVYSCMARQ